MALASFAGMASAPAGGIRAPTARCRFNGLFSGALPGHAGNYGTGDKRRRRRGLVLADFVRAESTARLFGDTGSGGIARPFGDIGRVNPRQRSS
ncbi:hypothetical protein ACEVHA_028065 [Klebsiella pneumoniae]